MKRLLKNWGMLFFALSVMAGCSEENAAYSGPDYVMFSDTLQTIAVQSDDTYYDIPVTATTACDYDRTYSVEVVDKGSNAIEGVHYDLQSNNVTIKAGERTSSIKIRGHYDNFEETDSIGVMLRLTADKDKIWDLYGRDTKVVLVKVCPFDINTFVGYAVLTSTFFTDYMQTTEMRLLTTEKDPEVENGIILKNFLYDGYDIKVSFNTDNPLQPLLEMEPQVVGSTVEAFQGSWHGDDKLRVMNATGAISYYNVRISSSNT